MRIEQLNVSLSEQYETFLLEREETLLYQSWRYQCFIKELLGCRQNTLLALDSSGRLQAALPLMAMDGPYGTVYNSSPFYGGNGGLIGENEEARLAIIYKYNEIAQQPETAASTIIENPLDPNESDVFDYQILDKRIGQFTRLPDGGESEANLMKMYHFKTRNMIRKGLKLGVKVSIDNSVFPFLIDVHKENMNHIGGQAKTSSFFNKLHRTYTPNIDYKIFVAKIDNEPIAALLTIYFNQTVEYFTPVIIRQYRYTQALSAVIFQAMRDSIECGYKWWNWGGTWLDQDGVYRFKSRWGTEDKLYCYRTNIRNKDILASSEGELLKAYPNFFVVPFSALIREG